MSAIFGFVRLDGRPAARRELAAMDRALADYGPDGVHLWHGGPAALGQRALHVTAEARLDRDLPRDDARGLVVAADAILDQRAELLSGLGLAAPEADAATDGRLLLEACRRWGEACVEKLLGDFAFAVWDARERRLVCARDAFGVRPLYYAHLPSKLFVFASSVAGVLAHPEVPRRLDEAMVADFLVVNYPKESTFYRDVRACPAAHVLTVTPASVGRRRYWRPEVGHDLRLPSQRDYAEALRHHVAEAVACRLRTVHRAGAHLSGGLDSSALAILAGRHLKERDGERLVTASFVPADGDGWQFLDERPYVESALEEGDFESFYVPGAAAHDAALTAAELVGADRPLTLFLRDQDARCAEEMAGRGVRTILSGWGGDEVASVNGRGFYAQLLLAGRWPTLWREGAARCRRTELSWHRFLLGHVLAPLAPRRMIELGNRLYGSPGFDRRVHSAIHPELARRWAVDRRLRRDMPSIGPDLRRNQARFVDCGHIQYRTENWALIGARYGLIYRFPLLDRRLVEFCLSVPPEQYVHDGWHRYLFRRAMAGILPEKIRWRTDKFSPMPDVLRVLARSRDRYLGRIEALRDHPRIAAYLDLVKMRNELEKLPDEDALRRRSRAEFAAGRDLVAAATVSVERAFALVDFLDAAGFA